MPVTARDGDILDRLRQVARAAHLGFETDRCDRLVSCVGKELILSPYLEVAEAVQRILSARLQMPEFAAKDHAKMRG